MSVAIEEVHGTTYTLKNGTYLGYEFGAKIDGVVITGTALPMIRTDKELDIIWRFRFNNPLVTAHPEYETIRHKLIEALRLER